MGNATDKTFSLAYKNLPPIVFLDPKDKSRTFFHTGQQPKITAAAESFPLSLISQDLSEV